MTTSASFVFGLLLYCLIARAILAIRKTSSLRMPLFAIANVATIVVLVLRERDHTMLVTAIYLAIAAAQLGLVRLAAKRERWGVLSLLFPIVVLVAMKLLDPRLSSLGYFVGISYVSFRLTHLALEVRNRVAPPPSVCEFFAYAFFPPVMFVGPITPYSRFYQTVVGDEGASISRAAAFSRVVVGLIKYVFLATLLNTLTYDGLLKDGRPHDAADNLLAIVAYYFFLYANFSGFCDFAVGMAGLLGIEVAENFDRPFSARNVKEFWNRWHITLSTFMRDLVFTPLSKAIIRRFGPGATPHAIAIAIMVVFLSIGLWHGFGLGFFIFGALHGLAVVANHYYALLLKKVLGRERLIAYNKSPIVRAVAVASTFGYVAFTFLFFANKNIVHHILVALRLAKA